MTDTITTEEMLDAIDNFIPKTGLLRTTKADYYAEVMVKAIRNRIEQAKPNVEKDWLPTAENINALPEPVRRYIHDIETNCDPPSLVRENIVLKENLKASEMSKEKIFVEHIENHLKQMGIKGKVVCKICEKDIDTIASEEGLE